MSPCNKEQCSTCSNICTKHDMILACNSVLIEHANYLICLVPPDCSQSLVNAIELLNTLMGFHHSLPIRRKIMQIECVPKKEFNLKSHRNRMSSVVQLITANERASGFFPVILDQIIHHPHTLLPCLYASPMGWKFVGWRWRWTTNRSAAPAWYTVPVCIRLCVYSLLFGTSIIL